MITLFLVPILALTIPVHVDTAAKPLATDWICTGGIPLHDGDLKDADRNRLQLLDAKGNVVPLQTRPLAWWNAEDAVKWLELTFPVRAGEANPAYTLTLADKPPKTSAAMLSVTDDGRILTVDGGRVRLAFDRETGSIIDRVTDGNGRPLFAGSLDSYVCIRDFQDGKRSGTYSTDLAGKKTLKLERKGAVEVTVLVKTEHAALDGRRTAVVDARITLAAGVPRFKVFHTCYVTENTAITVFPGYGLTYVGTRAGTVAYGVDGRTCAGTVPFSLRQDNDATATYPKFQEFDPVVKVKGGTGGRRADGWLKAGGVKVALRRFFEEYPNGFRVAADGRVNVEFWPSDKPEPLDFRRLDQRLPTDWGDFREKESKKIRGYEYAMEVFHRQMTKRTELAGSAFGAARSHEVWFDFSPDLSGANLTAQAERPLLPFVSGKWNCETRALGLVAPEDKAAHPGVERMWDTVFEAMWKHQTDWFHWYGTLNWGDWQTKFDQKGDRWTAYDVKYGWRKGGMDIPYTQLLWYFRGGRRFYYRLGEPAVLNLADLSSSHRRAYENEALMPRWWNASGTSRYGADRFCPGAGMDPEHLFAQSVQLGWLLTGNDYYRDLVEDFAESYAKFLKQYVYDKHNAPNKLHYHGREGDMPLRLACSAYENDPKNPVWREFLDALAEMFVCSFKSVKVGGDGAAYRSCNGLQVTQFFNSLYHMPALNCLMALRKDPQLEAAIRHAVPLYAEETANATGFAWLAALTGNRNYARFAARQVCCLPGYRTRKDPIDKGVKVMPEILGGTFSCYPTMLWAANVLGEDPDLYGEEENNYYPVSLPPCGEVTLVGQERCEGVPRPGEDGEGAPGLSDVGETIVFDFGPRSRLAKGAIPVADDYYPSTAALGGFASGLPFGVRAAFNGIWFDVWKSPLVVQANDDFVFPVARDAESVAILTGVCEADDAFHERPGVDLVLNGADGKTVVHSLTNMVHYQHRKFRRLYCERRYNAGRLNGLNLSVVRIAVPAGMTSFSLKDTGAGAKVVVFGATVIRKAQSGTEGLKFTLVRKTGRPGAPVTVRADGKTLLASVVPLAERTEYVVPWTGGVPKELEVVAGVFSHKTGSFRGAYEVVDPVVLGAARAAPAVGRPPVAPLVYGWTMPFEGRPLYVRTNTELVRTKGVTVDEGNLDWDGAYLEKADRMSFRADLPKGTWDVELRLSNTSFCRGGAKAWLSLQGRPEREIFLPPFASPPWGGGLANSRVPRHCIVRGRVRGVLNVTVRGLPPERRTFDDAYGLNAIILRRSADGRGEEGVISVEREILPWEREDFPISVFGAEEGGSALCTEAIALSVDACVRKGGGRVTVPRGRWLTGPVRLESNVELHLDEGATLVFTDDRDCYLPVVPVSYEGIRCLNYSPLVSAYGATNVSITGRGVLHAETDKWMTRFWHELQNGAFAAAGRIHRGWGEQGTPVGERDATSLPATLRPHFIHLNACKDVRLSDFTLKDSPFWCIHLYACENATVSGVTVKARLFNNDGVNPESSRNVLIENCCFETGDDAVAIKSGRDRDGRAFAHPCVGIEVRNCQTGWRVPSLVSIGSEVSGGIEDVFVHDCQVGYVGMIGQLKTNRTRGGFIRNIRFRDIAADEIFDKAFSVSAKYPVQKETLARSGEHLTAMSSVSLSGLSVRYYSGSLPVVPVRMDEDNPIRGLEIEDPVVRRHSHVAEFGTLSVAVDGEESDLKKWEELSALAGKTKACLTFIVHGPVSVRGWHRLRRLQDAGHAVGLSGLTERGLPQALGEGCGVDAYLRCEVQPRLAAARAAGVNPTVWGYRQDAWLQVWDHYCFSWEFPRRRAWAKSFDEALGLRRADSRSQMRLSLNRVPSARELDRVMAERRHLVVSVKPSDVAGLLEEAARRELRIVGL